MLYHQTLVPLDNVEFECQLVTASAFANELATGRVKILTRSVMIVMNSEASSFVCMWRRFVAGRQALAAVASCCIMMTAHATPYLQRALE
jgi:hypothetical protein